MQNYLDTPKRNPRPNTTGYLEDELVLFTTRQAGALGESKNVNGNGNTESEELAMIPHYILTLEIKL
ncbi:hypothetical protein [Nostoc sp. MS1]|uniref:hypothetical protein n=1 Tax=Nostoc sp. MS1 TaxID=2764711 RepID=UPI001CC70BF7|nr:hypothetical protein [Nostoc sp. MS1]BCL39825.1 hypothetical protein NSMS1_62720 [Nostoc sp. MS1]